VARARYQSPDPGAGQRPEHRRSARHRHLRGSGELGGGARDEISPHRPGHGAGPLRDGGRGPARAGAGLDDPSSAGLPSGEIVFVNELENTTRDAYYTTRLVYLQGRAAPLRIDPSGRFVRLRLPAYPQPSRSPRIISVLITDTELAPIGTEPYRAALQYFGMDRDITASGNRNFRAMTRGRGSVRIAGLLAAFRTNQE
jgi:hypothetical protein